MDTVNLEVTTRDPKLKAKGLRRESIIPAVFYGKKIEPVSIQMDYQTFRKVYIAGGQSAIIDLNIDGKQSEKVLVQDINLNPLTGKIDHVDFVKVNMKEEVTANVPIEVVGTAPAVKDLGGILNTVKTEITVKCLPTELPQSVEVDVSDLEEFGASIHISDLKLPEGVVVQDTPEDVVLNVVAPRIQEEEEAAVEADAEAAAAAVEGEEGEAAEGEEGEKAEGSPEGEGAAEGEGEGGEEKKED
ncbi:50S ribosomal protein L25 [Pseudomonadota bacterium]